MNVHAGHVGAARRYVHVADGYFGAARRYVHVADRYFGAAPRYVDVADRYSGPAHRYVDVADRYSGAAHRYVDVADRYFGAARRYVDVADRYFGQAGSDVHVAGGCSERIDEAHGVAAGYSRAVGGDSDVASRHVGVAERRSRAHGGHSEAAHSDVHVAAGYSGAADDDVDVTGRHVRAADGDVGVAVGHVGPGARCADAARVCLGRFRGNVAAGVLVPTESEDRTAESSKYDSFLREIARAPAASSAPDNRLPEGSADLDGGGRAAPDRLHALEEEDLREAIARFRRATLLSIVLWFSFFGVDVLVNSVFELHRLGTFLALRLIGVPLTVVELWCVDRYPSFRTLRVVDFVRLALACTVIALMCTFFHGFASPYAPGICLVLSTRLMVSTDPLRRSLITNAAMTLILPAVLFVGCAFVPSLRAQLHDPRAMSTFAVSMAFIQGTAGIVVIASHILWSLRRQLHEAKNVGRYKLKHRIGSGGMGEVWVAHHGALKRDIAIKILRPDVRDRSPEAVVRFEREVRATTELAHPNTVRVLDYGTTSDGLWYYVMELLHGETLAALVRRQGPLPPARAVRLAFQAARALGEAHARGIVHRDVKPENLFVTELGGEKDFVKVLDFGIAKLLNNESGVTTHEGSILGTPAYISPEVASGQPASARSDVYGLGAVIYFLLCGHPPFESGNVGEQLFAHIHKQPLPPSHRLGRALPPELEALVLACLAKDPMDRAASGSELATALSALALEDEGEAGRGLEGLEAAPPSRASGTAATVLQVPAVAPRAQG